MEAGVYSLQEMGDTESFPHRVEVGLLMKKGKILQEQETAYTKTQKCAFGGWEGEVESLQTAWPFWSYNNQGAGGKRGEMKLEQEERTKPSPKSRQTH